MANTSSHRPPSDTPVSSCTSLWVNQPEPWEQGSSGGAENGPVGRRRQMEKPATWRKEEIKERGDSEEVAVKAAGCFLGKED